MTAHIQSDTDGTDTMTIRVNPGFWTLVVTILTLTVTVTITIVTKPSKQEVQEMIDLSQRDLRTSISNLDEKISDTRKGVDRINEKLDEMNKPQRGSQ